MTKAKETKIENEMKTDEPVSETRGEDVKEEDAVEAEKAASEDVTAAETDEAETEDTQSEAAPESEAEEASAPDAEELKAEIEALKEEIAEKDDRHLRLQAEFDNFRRRTLREKDDLRQNATADLLGDLLPVLDNFDRALVHAEESPVLEGIVMVQRQLMDILERAGLSKAGEVGEAFDPKFHDAIMQEEREGTEAGVILEVLQPGYKLHDKLLRAAMVKVSQ
ncbi:MAG: nucleotide exchange factor GrpE [Bacillota bacterium]